MSDQDHLDRVQDILERLGVCMLTTRCAGGLRARPDRCFAAIRNDGL